MTDKTSSTALSVPDQAMVSSAIRLASRAPSVHNTQPWRWIFDDSRLHLFRDTDRLLVTTDPRGRQQVISCGAMLHHVRTAFAAEGWHTDTVRLPDPERPDLLATITFRPWPEPPEGVRQRARAIETRRTDRLPMLAPDGLSELLHTARLLVHPHDLELDVLEESAGPRVAAVSDQATSLQRYDMEYQTELHWWAGHSDVTEGVPSHALPSDAESARVSVGRNFPSAPHSARRGDIDDRARLLVLSTVSDSTSQWLQTGEALSVLLLECTAAGLATCTLTHITELPAGRGVLAGLLPRPGVPQVVIRVGTAPEDAEQDMIAPTPRRPVTDILTLRQR
ncbi:MULTISPECIES: Acg family FMN-binding oxidoreductase [Nocardia]|uniref:Acg family FMN-binding oxidoreductase n=1 Tax=Nocardia TaxID=1817 RepID=UPI000D69310E|nr:MULTISPECIES: hypothetical protein [Nocardia]